MRPAPRNWYQHRAVWGPRQSYTKAPCQTGPNAVPKSIKQTLRGSGRNRTPIITNNGTESDSENAYNTEYVTQKIRITIDDGTRFIYVFTYTRPSALLATRFHVLMLWHDRRIGKRPERTRVELRHIRSPPDSPPPSAAKFRHPLQLRVAGPQDNFSGVSGFSLPLVL